MGEGPAVQIRTARELGPLLDTMGTKQFFENLMKWKEAYGHPSMTLAELKDGDHEDDGEGRSASSLLEEGGEDEEREDGDEEDEDGDGEEHEGEEVDGDRGSLLEEGEEDEERE